MDHREVNRSEYFVQFAGVCKAEAWQSPFAESGDSRFGGTDVAIRRASAKAGRPYLVDSGRCG